MLYVKLAEHKQGDGKTDRLLVFDGTGKLESTEGISFWRTSSVKGENQTGRESPFKVPKLSRGGFSLSHTKSSTYPHLTCTARSLNSAFF